MKKFKTNKVLMKRVVVIVIAVVFCLAVIIWIGIDVLRSRQGEPQGLLRVFNGETSLSSGAGESPGVSSAEEFSGDREEGSEVAGDESAEGAEGTESGGSGRDTNGGATGGDGTGGETGGGRVWVDTSHWESVMVRPAWDEPVWAQHSFCDCGVDLTVAGVSVNDHMEWHFSRGEFGYGWHTETIQVESIYHEALYEDRWIVDGYWE